MTLTEILEKRKQRKALYDQARAVRDTAREEKRKVSAEEQEKFDRIMADIDELTKVINDEERLLAVEEAVSAAGDRAAEDEEDRDDEEPEFRTVFSRWMREGREGLSREERAIMQQSFQTLPGEARALAVGTGSAGGYTVPEDFYNSIVEAMEAAGGMRASRAEIIRSASGADLPIPTDDDTANAAVILSENTQAGEQDTTFGQKVLGSFTYSSNIIRVSYQLLQDSAFDIQAYVARKFAMRFVRGTNAHFTTGAGTTEPEGIVTGAALGKTGAGGQTDSITYEDLVDLEHSVDPIYRANAEIMMHDQTLKALKKLEDSQGRPLWLPGIAFRQPDTILGYPYIVNQDMAQMAASAVSVLFGDFSNYKIRDVLGMQMLRLEERYADYLQVGFLAFSRHDGALVDAGSNPVKYYQNAAT
jgi:HK97 family phage major capsid protein